MTVTPVGLETVASTSREIQTSRESTDIPVLLDENNADWKFHERVPDSGHLYARTIVDELFPVVVSPLTADVVTMFREAWAQSYTEAGVGQKPEGAAPAIATFGGRVFLNTTLLAQFGCNISGADPLAFTRQYTGNHPELRLQSSGKWLPRCTAATFSRWVETFNQGGIESGSSATPTQVGSGTSHADIAQDSLADLVHRVDDIKKSLKSAVNCYVRTELAFGVSVELITRTAESVGIPTFPGELLSGAGPGSSDLVAELWKIGRSVNQSENLATLLADHRAEILVGLRGSAGGVVRRNIRFLDSVRSLLAEYSHSGAPGLELAGETWGTTPELLLDVLTVLSAVADDGDPTARAQGQQKISDQRARQVRQALPATSDEAALFEVSMATARKLGTTRRVLLDRVSRMQHAVRLIAREIGHRYKNCGDLDDPVQIFMLNGAELAALPTDPARLSERARMRSYDYHALATRRAPYATTDSPRNATTWPRRGKRSKTAREWTGVLAGTPMGTSVTRGRTQTIDRPNRRSRPGVGNLLLISSGESSWVPFLAAVAGVVMDDGGPLSAVALACRDLKIPCLAATASATLKIPAYSLVSLDESTGTVQLAPSTLGHSSPGSAEKC